MSDPVRLGVLSAAHVHTSGYASVISDLEDAELAGFADADAERGAEAAERFDVPLLGTDALLAEVDGVVVCSTNTAHGEWVETAADAGVDVLCEKPLGTTVEAAVDIVETCDEAGVNLGVCMPLPFSEPAIRAKEAYDDGEFGDVLLATGTNRAKLRDRHVTGWSATPEHSGGGAVMDHTVHLVDLVRWITGEEVAEVNAELYRMHEDEELAVEDVNVLSIELTDGTPFTMDGSWNRPEELDYWGDATLELVGTEGEVSFDCFGQTLTHVDDEGEDPGIESLYFGSLPNEGLFSDFVDAVREDRTPKVSGRDGLAEAAVCVAAYESDERGEPVTVDYPDVLDA